jgi:GPH family glycoside/pentoside/hexuronide:cation symporter
VSSTPLPLSVRLAFGLPSFAGAAMAIPLAIHLTIFYSDVVLVPLGWIALAKAISRAFDAMTDAVMGWITDRTRSRWGRRRPYMALGAPAAAIAFVALFAPPEKLTPGAAAAGCSPAT